MDDFACSISCPIPVPEDPLGDSPPDSEGNGDLTELVISEGHARGRLRQADLAIAQRKSRYQDARMPKRFGPRVRATGLALKTAFTPDRVMPLRQTARSAQWLALDKTGRDAYQLQVTELRKTRDGVVTTVMELPLVFTSHFLERHIQSRRNTTRPAIQTCHACAIALLPLHVGQKQVDGTRAVEWSAHGSAWVRTPGFLLLGDIPHGEPIVMRTVLRDDVLDPPRQAVWDRLEAENRHLAVFDGGVEIPLRIAA